MKPGASGDGASRIAISAAVDRRTAEALALALRRRLKALGYEGVNITIAPGRASAPTAAGEKASGDKASG